jgi:cell division protein FtsB
MGIRPLYGVTIQQCIASGDLAKMKDVAQQAEEQLREIGNLSASLEVLKIEIAKLEQQGSS